MKFKYSPRHGRAKRRHGHCKLKTAAFVSWKGMFARCYYPSHGSYPNYGGRGIRVCERWHDFEQFYADMGDRPTGMSLDRINSDKDYTPENCRWATRTQQQRNRKNTVRLPFRGQMRTMGEISEMTGIPYEKIRTWRAAGRSIQKMADKCVGAR